MSPCGWWKRGRTSNAKVDIRARKTTRGLLRLLGLPLLPCRLHLISRSVPCTVALGQRRGIVLEDRRERLPPTPLVALPTASSETAIVADAKTGAPPLPLPQRFRPVKSRGINKSEQGRRAVVKKMKQTKIETSSPGVGPGISAFV